MRPYKTLTEIKKKCLEVKSSATNSDWFIAHCFPYLIEQLTEIKKQLKTLKVVKKRTLLDRLIDWFK